MDKDQKKTLRLEYKNYINQCFSLNETPISFYRFCLGYTIYKLKGSPK